MEYKIEDGLFYTKEHEWFKIVDKNIIIVGISDYAQHELGDITFVDLPEVGVDVEYMKVMLELEAVKSTVPVYSPASGKVIEVNTQLENNPELINKDPYGKGWLVKLEIKNAEELKAHFTPEKYRDFLEKIKEQE